MSGDIFSFNYGIYSTKKCFIAAAGNITTTVNGGRRAGPITIQTVAAGRRAGPIPNQTVVAGRRAGPMRGICTSFTIEKTQPRRRGQNWPLQNKNEK